MISVICPFYNEKENLNELHSRLLKVVFSLQDSWEIIFVNDGSSDGGEEYLKSLFTGHKAVRVIDLDKNYGLTTALHAGFQDSKGEILATLDADLQNPPEEIPRLLTLLEDQDMVTGIRAHRQDAWVTRLSSRIANPIRRIVLGDSIQDIGCSLRVFRRPALGAFYPFRGMHRFFPALAEAHGFKIQQVPVEHHPRRHGRSKYGLANRILGPLWDLCAVRWLLNRRIQYKRRPTT